MKKSIKYICCAMCLGAVFFSGCAASHEVVSVPYTDETLVNYQAGKDFLAAGRYELAKESFTLALASSREPEMRYALMREIDSVNMMIQTRR